MVSPLENSFLDKQYIVQERMEGLQTKLDSIKYRVRARMNRMKDSVSNFSVEDF